MKATHWTCNDDPEGWSGEPQTTPELAVEQWLADDDDGAGDMQYDLMRGTQFVEVYGCYETDAPLEEESQFDGYEPGQSYFAPTRETVRVEVSLQFRVVPKAVKSTADAKDALSKETP